MIAVTEIGRDRLPAPAPRGLPVPPLGRPAPPSAGVYVTTTVDDRGRMADRSPLRELGWAAGSSVSFRLVEGAVVVVTPTCGSYSVTRQGHLRLPATLRHRCRLSPGARILVVAVHDLDLLEIYTPAAVDSMLLSYRRSLRVQPNR